MTAKELAAVAAAIVVLAVAGAEVIKDKPLSAELVLEPSKAMALEDGGLAYAVKVREADGGYGWRSLPSAPCVRRKKSADAGSCLRLGVLETSTRAYDPGALVRFPATEKTGDVSGCEPIACSVYAGESADEADSEKVKRATVKALPAEELP